MIEQDLRDRILSEPEVILDDRDVMDALVAANERAMGTNIVDLRAIAMQRLAHRLDRLEDTHRTVIAAAYENLAGTNQVQRAILHLLDAMSFEAFIAALAGPVAQSLRVEAIRLVLETRAEETEAALARLDPVLVMAEAGFVEAYLAGGRELSGKPITLRLARAPGADAVYGTALARVRSEALMRLDFGPGRLPGLLVLGAADPQQFRPHHGTELLGFLAGVFERAMRRWLG